MNEQHPSRHVLATAASGLIAGFAMLALVYTILTHHAGWAEGVGGVAVFLILSGGGFLIDEAITTWLRHRDGPPR